MNPVNSKLDGQQAEGLLHEVGVAVNRDAVLFDLHPPKVISGLHIGTPALAVRGFGVKDFAEVADIVGTTLVQGAFGTSIDIDSLHARVGALTDAHPPYAGLGE